jgi:hypothetical protein
MLGAQGRAKSKFFALGLTWSIQAKKCFQPPIFGVENKRLKAINMYFYM